MSTVVHYTNHFDNDTKGWISFTETDDIERAILLARIELTEEYLTDLDADSNADPQTLFTITKAEVVESVQAWTGVPAAGF